jgi:hypothetical protein
MANQRDRQEFIHLYMKYAPLATNENEGDLRRKALRLMRYATTHVRIETELTNGYKDRQGNWDEATTKKAIVKRDRIDAKMEALAPIVYGSLTVSVRMGNREFYIPATRA